MAEQYGFNHRRNEYLSLMWKPEMSRISGRFASGHDQIIDPDTDWEGIDIAAPEGTPILATEILPGKNSDKNKRFWGR